jgi:hypothetical protein
MLPHLAYQAIGDADVILRWLLMSGAIAGSALCAAYSVAWLLVLLVPAIREALEELED